MAKDLGVTVLLDVYGQLLTEKQRNAVDMYYNEDLSLAEISEETGISRQGVLASIKLAEKHLAEYERQLGIVSRFRSINSRLTKIDALLENAEFDGKDKITEYLSEIRNEI